MQTLPFFKMSGAGNDFVVLDNRLGQVKGDLNAFSAAVADRKRGIGGDGVLLVEPSPRKHFRMRYFN
ncbi:MAG TPA: diaminopimelate epimerase, partial [bacterium]|nr:diaminopimelate epimerase [bacterium]